MNANTKDLPDFQLPKRLNHLLRTLSTIYKDQHEHLVRKLIVNSQVRCIEAKTGDVDHYSQQVTYGHTVYLDIPESLYPTSITERLELGEQFRRDINTVHIGLNEYISNVYIEMEEAEDRNWREESGLLLPRQRVTAPAAAARIWGTESYRVFLSHKSEVKVETAALKQQLAQFGISAFVAHADIQPTKKWQDEIENALASMDAFVALLTAEFHESDWTDQEVGYALDRGVPVIAVKLGKAPYGFLGKFQALACCWDESPLHLAKLLIRQPRMLDCYIAALHRCKSFSEGNTLSELLSGIEELSDSQVRDLIAANDGNMEVRESFGFRDGLATHLSRIVGKIFIRTPTGQIEFPKG